jgi:hypothetical protein
MTEGGVTVELVVAFLAGIAVGAFATVGFQLVVGMQQRRQSHDRREWAQDAADRLAGHVDEEILREFIQRYGCDEEEGREREGGGREDRTLEP